MSTIVFVVILVIVVVTVSTVSSSLGSSRAKYQHRFEDKEKPEFLNKMNQDPEVIEKEKYRSKKKKSRKDRDMFISDNNDFEI